MPKPNPDASQAADDANTEAAIAERQRWMRVLAHAARSSLEHAWADMADKPAYTLLRGPEVGTAMVRARAGGTGQRFNAGEMTVCRCAVRLDDGTTGHAYITGRDKRKAELAAAIDALMQAAPRRAELETSVIRPLEARQTAAREARSRKAAATRVDFFTMVRGDG